MLAENDFDILKLTSFKIGGKVKNLYFPETLAEFVEILEAEPEAVVVGNLSNILVSSKGYDGALICTKRIDEISVEGNIINASAGVRGTKLSKLAAAEGLSGLEFMIAFPGSVGGEVYMNASANGQAVSDNFIKARCCSLKRGVFELTKDEMNFGYRTSICQEKGIKVLSAEFELEPMEPEKVNARMQACLEFRRSHQPLLSLPNCGSIFKNPPGNSAGKLLDECGVKGLKQGGVEVWENHANFIVNSNGGSSLDVLELMLKMRDAVSEKFEINLEPEIIYLGGNNSREDELCKMLYQKMQK